MTAAIVVPLASQILRRTFGAACRCAGQAWRAELSRKVGGTTLRVEVRSG